jgi:hypothetical protein
MCKNNKIIISTLKFNLFRLNFKVYFIILFISEIATIIAATGYSSLNTVEMVKINSNLNCQNLPNLTVGRDGAEGTLFNQNRLIICGGFNSPQSLFVLSECEELIGGSWTAIASMNQPRCLFGSSRVIFRNNEGFIVTGGKGSILQLLNSSEIFDGSSWTSVADLPMQVNGHCMVNINNGTTVMAIGGSLLYSLGISTTFFYDSVADSWSPGPDLIVPRTEHSCAVFSWFNSASGLQEQYVVVAGGENKASGFIAGLDSTEFWKVGDPQGFVLGQNLSVPVAAGKLVPVDDGLILAGGVRLYYGTAPAGVGYTLFQLSRPDGPWIELNQTLKEARYSFVGLRVPDDLFPCN